MPTTSAVTTTAAVLVRGVPMTERRVRCGRQAQGMYPAYSPVSTGTPSASKCRLAECLPYVQLDRLAPPGSSMMGQLVSFDHVIDTAEAEVVDRRPMAVSPSMTIGIDTVVTSDVAGVTVAASDVGDIGGDRGATG